MDNGTNYEEGKLYYHTRHSDFSTFNQLNTPPEWLSDPFQIQKY